MSTTHALSALALSLTLVHAGAGRVWASPAPTDPPAAAGTAAATAAQDDDDNDASFEPAEPDFRLINLPTTLRLPLFKGSFDLTHRFGGNLRRGDFGAQAEKLFGIDDGATVGFEYRVAIARHLEAAAFRTAFGRTIQLYGKYDAIHQHGSTPLSASIVASVEGTNNFRQEYAPAIGVTVSRQIADHLALYVVPTWVHNSAAATGVTENTAFVGLGGRVRVSSTVYVAAEVSPRVSGYAPGKSEFGFALEKRAGGHVFQLNFTDSFGTTLAQTARGGQPGTLYMGFNLSRKFF